MKNLIPYIIIAILACFIFRQCNNPVIRTEYYTDTIILRDTIHDTIPIPKHIFISRIDTVFLALPSDTALVAVQVPIEQKTYESENYRAIIEGHMPKLLSMEVFPETKYVTNTVINTINKRQRFGIGVQTGYGMSKDGLSPYIGVGISYNIINF